MNLNRFLLHGLEINLIFLSPMQSNQNSEAVIVSHSEK